MDNPVSDELVAMNLTQRLAWIREQVALLPSPHESDKGFFIVATAGMILLGLFAGIYIAIDSSLTLMKGFAQTLVLVVALPAVTIGLAWIKGGLWRYKLVRDQVSDQLRVLPRTVAENVGSLGVLIVALMAVLTLTGQLDGAVWKPWAVVLFIPVFVVSVLLVELGGLSRK